MATRTSKAMMAMKLKEKDEVVNALVCKQNILLTSKNGYYTNFSKVEVPLVGVRGSGVKAMNLKEDEIVSLNSFDEFDYAVVITKQNTAKRIKASEFVETGRAKKGNALIKRVKSNPYEIRNVILDKLLMISIDGITKELKVTDIPIMDLSSTGSLMSKKTIDFIDKKYELEKKEVKESKKEQQAFNLDDFKL